MTDYVDYREANRDSAFIRPTDPLSIRRSTTRNSHYSHGSVSASTRSWVYSTQQNPPPPPEAISSPSPIHTVRPLPNPQLQPQHPMYYTTNAGDDEEEEYMNIDPNGDGLATGYRTEGLGRGRSQRIASPRIEGSAPGSRSFVGGFVRGLRKIPKVVLGYGGNGDKRKFFRRATGTEGTATSITGMTGNTLPRYTSNPSTPLAGPSNTQYFQAEQMPMPSAPSPPGAGTGSGSSYRHRHPSFRITPPSEVVEREESGLEYVSEPHAPQFPGAAAEPPPQNDDRTTVLLYQDVQQDVATPPLSRPASTPLRRSDSAPIRRSDSHHQPSEVPEVNEVTSPPVNAHPLPTTDYRKMGSLLSPTSPTTLTTTTFTSDPSFSSELHPVKRFFSTLYHMPWIARDRVTVDYRPGGIRGAKRGIVKKPMASWYRGTPGVVTSAKTGSGSLDLLSSGSGSRRESGGTGPSPIASPLSERVKPRSSDRHRHHRRDRHHHRDRDRDRRRERHSRHRDTVSTNATREMQHLRSTSPIVPSAYPYPYPYPYPAYPSFPPPLPAQQSNSQSSPRGPRSYGAPTFPPGFIPYQPPPPPPPPPQMYVIHSPAQTQGSGSGDTSHGQSPNQGQMLSPMYMQLVPGSFNAEGMGSHTSSPLARPAMEPTA